MSDPSDQSSAAASGPPPLHPDRLTWTLMLGRWVEFARAAVGLPKDHEGQALRDSVPDIIMLQAVWFSLQHCDELSASERALGVDRAEVLIDKHAGQMMKRWAPGELPPQLMELIVDARKMLEQVRNREL